MTLGKGILWSQLLTCMGGAQTVQVLLGFVDGVSNFGWHLVLEGNGGPAVVPGDLMSCGFGFGAGW